jgi:hypothetical protein
MRPAPTRCAWQAAPHRRRPNPRPNPPPDPRPRPQHQNHQSHHRELLRDLILDPTCDYQPTGNPKGGFDRAAHAAATDVIAYMGVTKVV